MENEHLIQELIEEINRAFAKTPYPGKDIGDELELKRFVGKKWRDLTLEDINSNDHLHFFTPVALRYYVPAYLIATLLYPTLRSDIRSALVHDLGPGLDPDWRNKDINLYSIFSPEERTAIRHFFESYHQLFPLPEADLTLKQASIQQKRKQTLKACTEYWQLYG